MADISGFTQLTAEESNKGPEGVERLSSLLNDCFGGLIDVVSAHHGHVLTFAGDAMLAAWEAAADDYGDASLTDCARHAALCGLAMQAQIDATGQTDGVALSLRIALAQGEGTIGWLGGVGGRWLDLLTGRVIEDVGRALSKALPGEVLVGASARPSLTGVSVAVTERGDGCGRLDRLEITLPPLDAQLAPLDVPDAHLEGFVPGVVRFWARAGQAGFSAALRQITAVFALLPALDLSSPAAVESSNQLVRSIQEAVRRHGGEIDKLTTDDKGLFVLAAWGLPSRSHEDDAARAVRAAQEVRRSLSDGTSHPQIGIATGPTYCGPVGHRHRREYTIIGPAVNLAARLMSASDGQVLVAPSTRAAAAELVFEDGPLLSFKGVRDAVRTGVPTDAPTREPAVRGSTTPMVGRERELGLLVEPLVRLGSDGAMQAEAGTAPAGRVRVIEGDAGVGKSRLVEAAIERAVAEGLELMRAKGVEVERATPYRSVRPLVETLLGLQPTMDAESRGAAVLDILEGLGEAARAPLLAQIVPLDLPQTTLTTNLRAEVRAENVHEVVRSLLADRASKQPVLVVVDDAQWLDSASLALLRALALGSGPWMLLISTRPPEGAMPVEASSLFELSDQPVLRLSGLDQGAIGRHLANRLGLDSLDPTITSTLHGWSQGNPFFAEELLFALRDAGDVAVEEGRCVVKAAGGTLPEGRLPLTIQGVVNARVDLLPAQQQLLLKVASVVGATFSMNVVGAVLADVSAETSATSLLPALRERALVRPVSDDESVWAFHHDLAAESIYGGMLFAQRRSLHRSVAEQLASATLGQPDPAVLANHWQQAECWPQAVASLDQAATAALRQFANVEAIAALERARALTRAHGVDVDVATETRWLGQLAEAWFRVGDQDACQRYAVPALDGLGFRSATGALGKVLGLLGRASRRVVLGDRPALAETEAARRRRVYALGIQNRLTEIAIYANDPLTCMYSALRELDMAQQLGPSALLARSLAGMSMLLGTVPMTRVALRMADQAAAVVQGGDDPGLEAFVLSRLSLPWMYVSDWERCEGALRTALRMAEEQGDRRLQMEAATILGIARQQRGDFVEQGEIFERLEGMARAGRAHQPLGWSLGHQAYSRFRRGQLDGVPELLEEGVAYVEEQAPVAEYVIGAGMQSICRAAIGDLDRARYFAEQVVVRSKGQRPVAYWVGQGIADSCETLLALHGAADSDNDQTDLLRLAELGVKSLATFTKVFTFAEPRLRYTRARIAAAAGDPETATTERDAALDAANRIGVPYIAGLCHAWRAVDGIDAESEARLCSDTLTPLGVPHADDPARVHAGLVLG